MSAQALRFEHRQQQTLTPRLQHAVRLLQLSSMDFAQELQHTLGRNPFLEVDEAEEPIAAEAVATEAEAMAELTAETDRDPMAIPGSTPRTSGSGDGEMSAMEMVAADVSLRQHLHTQLNIMNLPERERVLTGLIVEALDDDGYLRVGLDELAALCEFADEPDGAEMEAALKVVQGLDPCGVAARSVGECVLLQVGCIEDEQERELARTIVAKHIERLAHRDIPGLAKLTGATVAQLEAVCERIRHLDPRPGWRFGNSHISYVTPDVIVKKVRGTWTAVLNPAVIPRVKLNEVYAELFQRHRESQHSELAAHLQEARWTVRNVEQRFSTILSVAQAIVRRQWKFLEYGALAMKPLGLREIAEEVGVHESTVSRVTNNKYMVTPSGTHELKYFFSRAMPTASGGACTGTAIRGVIQDLLAAEDAAEPLSDAEIARRLAAQGLHVARRTVTKYRQMLRVPSVGRRRRHTPAAEAV